MNASVHVLTAGKSDSRSKPPLSHQARAWLSMVGLGALSIVLWLLSWEAASRYEWSLFFRFENIPAPSEVVGAAGELLDSPKFVEHVLSSVRRVFLGFVIASALAMSIGLVVGRLGWARKTLLPPLEVIRPIPAVAWIPIAILLFASSERSMVFITFIGAFFPVLLNTVHGVESVDLRLINAARSLGASQLAIFREVVLPGALLVLWERWTTGTDQTFDGTYAMRIDGSGTALAAASRVSDVHLPRGDDAFVDGGAACWVTGAAATGVLTEHCVSPALAATDTMLP